jgi:hypothetical protein
MKVLFKEIRKAYLRVGEEGTIPLKFTSQYTNGDQIYVDSTTGVLRSKKTTTEKAIADYWSDVIYKSTNIDDYSAIYPFAQARLVYVLLTIKDFLNQNNLKIENICDFATGQGYFLKYGKDLLPNVRMFGTEASDDLVASSCKDGYEVYKAILGIDNSTAENITTDFGVVSWTLCNCVNVIGVLKDIHKKITKNGYLCVADSSRIMVPYRKSLSDFLISQHPLDIHPYYFSFNALRSLLEASGFSVKYFNRYFDSDVLCLIAQKIEEPDDLDTVEVDDPSDVVRFMENWHNASNYFEQLRK